MEDFNIPQTQTNNKYLNFVKEVTRNENVTSESLFIPQLSWLIPENARDLIRHNLMFILIVCGKQLTTYYRSKTTFYFCIHNEINLYSRLIPQTKIKSKHVFFWNLCMSTLKNSTTIFPQALYVDKATSL